MLNMIRKDPTSNTTGPVTAVTVMADGRAIARIADADGIEHWFDVEGLVSADG